MVPKRDKRKIPKRSAGALVITPPTPRPPGDNPSLQLFREAIEAEKMHIVEIAPTTHHLPPTTHHLPPTTQPIAPEKDFARVPNSVARDAIPAGLFRGESKKLYDALYQRTRGAVVPRRSIRATQSDLMDWARVSHNTLKAHIKHLSRTGLLRVHYVRGDNTGAEYEVLIPEELPPPPTNHPPTTHQPPTTQILGPPTNQNLVLGGGGQTAGKSVVYEPLNTFINTIETFDDETSGPFTKLISTFSRAAEDITGKKPSAGEAERWEELAEVLVTELKMAAARTSVSNVPAFMAEHLRRRLWKKEKREVERDMEERGEPASGKVDASNCPDCFGTGMYYPEGFDKGVARCLHEKLVRG